ncbi:hypothetical protein [Rhodococcus erythropolis]|uniref:hypothetical protein n=1 Tax=Rhodococcus erythropolis TaxID=1833 RepID=UPI003672798F
MSDFGDFAEVVFGAVRPTLPADVLRGIDESVADGQLNQAVIEAIVAVSKRGIGVPVDVRDEIRARIADGVSFRPRDAKLLQHFFVAIEQVSAA